MKRLIPLICLMLALMLTLSSCAALPLLERLFGGIGGQTPYPTTGGNGEVNPAGSRDLMKGVTKRAVADRAPSDKFLSSQMDFCVELFKKSVSDESGEGKNPLVSPLSVMIALSMTANGASGETLAEMEKVLGGGMNVKDLDAYLRTYLDALPSSDKCKLTWADAIWFKDDPTFTVRPDFLQTNADYFNAAAYAAPFDDGTAEEINRWVSERTDGMIDKIVDKLDPRSRMILLNALLFDAKWSDQYTEDDVGEAVFNASSGEQSVNMMYSIEEGGYLDDGSAVGFVKSYSGSNYYFAALMPNEGISLDGYIAKLTGEKLLETLKNRNRSVAVRAGLPKFKTDFSISMNGVLSEMGMPTAFDGYSADFSAISDTPLYIGSVIHKTAIELTESGTKAAAVTAVGMYTESIEPVPQAEVILDRPFLYMIVDARTDLPIFIGAMNSAEE